MSIGNLNELRNISKEDILGALGLQSKSSGFAYALPAVGIFAAGVLVGVGLGMLFAPKAGTELREDLQDQYNKALDLARQQFSTMTDKVQAASTSMGSASGSALGSTASVRTPSHA